MTPVRVLLVGAAGRMGQAIATAAQSPGVLIIPIDIGDAIEASIADCDVVVDFSQPDATERNCAVAVAHGKPLVIGTTGQSPAQFRLIQDASKKVPVLLAANFSTGVNTLFWLTRKAAELLGDNFDLEIIETHHHLKKDAPSGTAKRLAEILKEARPASEVGVHSLRAGDVVGDHTVIFAAAGERLELTHKASSRETFALGALRAGRWVLGKPPGLYHMEDVLGLSAL